MTEANNPENNNKTEEELNITRVQLLQQIFDMKENFFPKLDSLKSNFCYKYDDNCSILSNKLKQIDIKMEKVFGQDKEMEIFKKRVNSNLEKIMENLNENTKKFLEQIEIYINNMIKIISNESLNDLEEYANQLIIKKENEIKSEQEKQKKLEEEEQRKKEEEQKKLEEEQKKLEREKQKKLDEEQNKIYEKPKLEEEKPKSDYIEIPGNEEEIKSIELDGKNDNLSNIKSMERLNDYNQIILKDFSLENIEYILNPSNNKYITENNSLKKIIFKNCNLENIDISKLFPNIDKLKIKDSKLAFDIKNYFNFNNMEILKLENIGLIDNNFNDLFDKIRTNEQIRKKLKIFSVKNNKISYIDYKRGYADNILSSMIFTNLEILDMSYNKLYLFPNQMFNCLEKIKFIDLTENNISFPQNISGLIKSAKIKKCLILLTRNLAILKEPENIEYNNYLKENLTKIDFPIKKIVLDNIFCGKLFNNIFELDFSFFKNSLQYLDLSNSELHDKDLITIFNNKKLYFSGLKKLVLTANYLTQEFLYFLSNESKEVINMDNLQILKLSENDIKCTDVAKFKKFLEFFKNLISLELKCTPFEKNVNQYFRKKIIQSYDPENKKGYTKPLDEDEKKVEEILSGHYLQNNTKMWIQILDANGGKYTEKINQSFPELIERINVENKFPYKS